jgi:ferredoxin
MPARENVIAWRSVLTMFLRVRRIDEEDFSSLSFVGKLKSRAHGRLTAYTPQADLCQACGLCVVACPEKAITLVSSRDWSAKGIA